ncbi:MAG: hypothetical protein JSU94_01720 [Phycisphaerales bacterium]|nr:MAG: hypothetical protein JSU94_01720 [Phycisphaerales bacterium]
MKASQFNIFLGNGISTGIYNSFTGRVVVLPQDVVAAVKKSDLERLSETNRRLLTECGLLVPRSRDEHGHFLDSVRRREQSERWADIVFVSSAQSLRDDMEKRALKRIESHVGELAASGSVDVVKLRLLGRSSRPVEERIELLGAMLRIKSAAGLPVLVMWMSDDLSEAAKLNDAPADAFSFLFDLSRRENSFETVLAACRRVTAIATRSRGAYIGIVTDNALDIERRLMRLRWAVKSSMQGTTGSVQWGLHLRTSAQGLYCRPDSCLGPGGLLNSAKVEAACSIRDMGIPVKIALNGLNLHSNCPYRNPRAQVFDWRGGVFRCLEDADAAAGPGGDAVSECACSEWPLEPLVFSDAQCRSCPMLPICSNGCPRKGRVGVCPDYSRLLSRWLLGRSGSDGENF